MLDPLLLLHAPPPADSADAPALRHRNGAIPRSVTAVFAPHAPPVDGRLDDPPWALAIPATGFRREVPTCGRPAPQETGVRVLYDRDALHTVPSPARRSTSMAPARQEAQGPAACHPWGHRIAGSPGEWG